MIGTSARLSSNDLPRWLAFGVFAVCWLTLLGGIPCGLSPTTLPWARYLRGPDMGGGVGGLLYSIRAQGLKFNLSNGRGDIVAQSDPAGTLTWTASYEAYGKRTLELGSNEDRQRANTKEEDPTGLLNEGFRYRDIETGVWLSRDPAGFVDGPNLYAYVKQNPWTSFDPEGLYQQMPAALLHTNGINTTSHAYQQGFQQGATQGAKIGFVIGVGVGVTVASGGLATAASATVFGSGTLATSYSAAALSGAAGSIAANSTGNVIEGRPAGEGIVRAGTTGALFSAAGQVMGNTALAFKQGMAEANGLAASAKATASTANAMAQANKARGGAAGGLVSGDEAAAGLSYKAAGGVTPVLNPRVQAAMDSTPNGMRSPFHGGCAEPQMASNLLNAGGSTEGAVSYVGAVRASGNPTNGRPMAPCSSCNEMNGKLGIIDMNATHASSGSGQAGGAAGAAATTAERERRGN
jgi:RHS repeat-associated protein